MTWTSLARRRDLLGARLTLEEDGETYQGFVKRRRRTGETLRIFLCRTVRQNERQKWIRTRKKSLKKLTIDINRVPLTQIDSGVVFNTPQSGFVRIRLRSLKPKRQRQ